MGNSNKKKATNLESKDDLGGGLGKIVDTIVNEQIPSVITDIISEYSYIFDGNLERTIDTSDVTGAIVLDNDYFVTYDNSKAESIINIRKKNGDVIKSFTVQNFTIMKALKNEKFYTVSWPSKSIDIYDSVTLQNIKTIDNVGSMHNIINTIYQNDPVLIIVALNENTFSLRILNEVTMELVYHTHVPIVAKCHILKILDHNIILACEEKDIISFVNYNPVTDTITYDIFNINSDVKIHSYLICVEVKTNSSEIYILGYEFASNGKIEYFVLLFNYMRKIIIRKVIVKKANNLFYSQKRLIIISNTCVSVWDENITTELLIHNTSIYYPSLAKDGNLCYNTNINNISNVEFFDIIDGTYYHFPIEDDITSLVTFDTKQLVTTNYNPGKSIHNIQIYK